MDLVSSSTCGKHKVIVPSGFTPDHLELRKQFQLFDPIHQFCGISYN